MDRSIGNRSTCGLGVMLLGLVWLLAPPKATLPMTPLLDSPSVPRLPFLPGAHSKGVGASRAALFCDWTVRDDF